MSAVDLICSQTNYTPEEASRYLASLKDPVAVIRAYLCATPTAEKEKNANQLVYSEISKFMEEKYRVVGR